MEDNQIPLDMIRSFVLKEEEHDFEAAARNALAERDEAIDAARSGLTKEEQAVFDSGLASNQAANFPWWQDDHNYYIDLKVMIPLRRICQELSARVGGESKDDMLYLFWPELVDVANGKPYSGELKSLVKDRRQYFDHWGDKRGDMPKVLGTVPETVEDPVLIEIFGLNPAAIRAVQNPNAREETVLSGLAAAKGTATGVARVLQSSDDMHRLEPGSILVCESTSPSWTPAFGKIAGAVCDGGGMLSHAAIVGREYGVPTVTACGIATFAIKDGDTVQVDGSTGTVTDPQAGGGRGDRRDRGGGPGVTSRCTQTSVVWVDEVDPATAVAAAGSKMGRLDRAAPRGRRGPARLRRHRRRLPQALRGDRPGREDRRGDHRAR